MNILMLISSFHPLVGGAEIQAQRLSKQLISEGYNITILTRWHKGLKYKEKFNGINIIRIPVSSVDRVKPILFLIKSLIYIFKNKKDIDILHAHSLSSCGFSASLASLLFKIPSISKIAGGGNENGCEAIRMYANGGGKKLRIKFIRKYLSKFIAISNDIQSDLNKIGVPSEKVEFIPNGIDTKADLSKPVPREISDVKTTKKNIFLYAGRLECIKGIDILLEAWNKTSPEFKKESQLMILGVGSYNVNKYLKDPSISFLGKISNVDDYMQHSDYFILPSRYEGISNALLEALRNKLLVISTPVGGNKDIIKNLETGYLFESENTNDLKNILESINSVSEKKISDIKNNAYDLISEEYSFAKVTNSYKNLYRELVNKTE